MEEGRGRLLCESVWDETLTLQTPITRRVAYEVYISYIYIYFFFFFFFSKGVIFLINMIKATAANFAQN